MDSCIAEMGQEPKLQYFFPRFLVSHMNKNLPTFFSHARYFRFNLLTDFHLVQIQIFFQRFGGYAFVMSTQSNAQAFLTLQVENQISLTLAMIYLKDPFTAGHIIV